MARGKQFQEVYETYKHDIRVSALSQRVPGLDYDDVVSEMTICLWKATETYRAASDTSFGSYWWSLWLNRRSDIAQAYYAAKRIHPVLSDEPLAEGSYVAERMPEAPKGCSDTDRLVWDLLAVGDTAKDIMDDLELSRRRYYSTIQGWRTEEVRDALRG